MQGLDVDTILGALGLNVYRSLIREKNVDYDAFVNMTCDDMTTIGITIDEHKKILINNLKPLRDESFSELAAEPFDTQACLDIIQSQLRVLRGVLLVSRMQLDQNEGKMENYMCDPMTSGAHITYEVTRKCCDSLTLIDKDLKAIEKGTSKRWSSVHWAFLSGMLSIGGLSLFLLVRPRH